MDVTEPVLWLLLLPPSLAYKLSDVGASLSTVFLRALGEWCILWGHSQSHNPLMDLLFRLTHFAQPLPSSTVCPVPFRHFSLC